MFKLSRRSSHPFGAAGGILRHGNDDLTPLGGVALPVHFYYTHTNKRENREPLTNYVIASALVT